MSARDASSKLRILVLGDFFLDRYLQIDPRAEHAADEEELLLDN